MCARSTEQSRSEQIRRICEVDRGGGGGGRDVLLFHQDFTGKQMHQATAEKKMKNKKNKLKGMKKSEEERGKSKREVACGLYFFSHACPGF